MYTTLFAHFVLLTPVFWLSLHVISLGGGGGGAGLCTCGAITLELITISFKKYVFKRVIQNWVENIPFSWVINLLSCVCILSTLNAPWAYHLWIRRNINYTYYYYYYYGSRFLENIDRKCCILSGPPCIGDCPQLSTSEKKRKPDMSTRKIEADDK